MKTQICALVGSELPIFAFSPFREVVAAVTRAGGFGVLGASIRSPQQLDTELAWIDDHTDGRAYGVDVLIPTTYDERAEASPEELENMIPREHRDFLDKILSDAGVPTLPKDEKVRVRQELAAGRGAMTPQGARRLVRTALDHPGMKMVVSALGAPPPDMMGELKQRDIVVGALCGKAAHARRQIDAGVQVLVAQGTEAGGHTGDVSTLVLVPEVVSIAGDKAMVLAAGGITHGSQIAASLAMGAQGVWLGTIFLGTQESGLDEFEKKVLYETPTEGTVRRKARTGKMVRMIKSQLSEVWEQPGAPTYLPTPLQGVLYNEAHARVVRAQRKDLYSFPAGQSVGALTSETSVADVMHTCRCSTTKRWSDSPSSGRAEQAFARGRAWRPGITRSCNHAAP